MPISKDLTDKWLLTDLEEWNSGICFANSGLYGPVVLKRNEDIRQLQREYDALLRMGAVCCKVYGFAEGILLEERILPGERLREVPSLEKRLDALTALWQDMHFPAEDMTYLNWVENACNVPELPDWLGALGCKAEKICGELFDRYPERMLLHGDLHHDNILRRQDGSYAVIDPKGVVGPRILDLPRFLLNEPIENVLPAMESLTAMLGYPSADLRKAYFVEAVLANMWLAEDGLYIREDLLSFAEYLLKNG